MIRMLYYPLVTPPPDILAQGVLYWDGLGSIAPYGYRASPELAMLDDSGLFEMVEPETLLAPRVDAVAAQIEELLDRLTIEQLAIPEGPLTGYTRLYRGKMPGRIQQQLVDYGVIRDEGDVFRASSHLLGPMLAITARAIADEARGLGDRNRWVCHTNIRQAFAAAYSASDHTQNERAWRLNLAELFPSPTPDTSLQDLVSFRERHDDERRRLLTHVAKLAQALGGIGNPDLVPELAAELEIARREMRAAIMAHGIKTAGSAVSVAIGAELAIMNEVAASIPGAGVVSAILMGAVAGVVRRGPTNPYTYLHHIEDEFQTQPMPSRSEC